MSIEDGGKGKVKGVMGSPKFPISWNLYMSRDQYKHLLVQAELLSVVLGHPVRVPEVIRRLVDKDIAKEKLNE